MVFGLPSWYLLTKDLRPRNHHDIVNTGLLLHGEFLPVSMVSSTSTGHQARDSGQSGDCPMYNEWLRSGRGEIVKGKD